MASTTLGAALPSAAQLCCWSVPLLAGMVASGRGRAFVWKCRHGKPSLLSLSHANTDSPVGNIACHHHHRLENLLVPGLKLIIT